MCRPTRASSARTYTLSYSSPDKDKKRGGTYHRREGEASECEENPSEWTAVRVGTESVTCGRRYGRFVAKGDGLCSRSTSVSHAAVACRWPRGSDWYLARVEFRDRGDRVHGTDWRFTAYAAEASLSDRHALLCTVLCAD